ncbi:LysR family transcriptional regulator [Pseudomonas aeruginosa]|uniref:LysR family transcriptional regulator n=1 Tax=Pseudomonas aeruginosa TaxID=287 RepID=UPI000F5232C3|nr:LysR family transcriptional regulator [Pseudomonas aeruginosa]RPX75039.1 LysR family transcriptional regulator [Pseudomonas aeruginosa]
MNWDDTRVFLALCREHTLRGAARALHIDQATVGRRLASLEAALGSTLFLRTSSGYLLTPAGEAAFELAEKMERSALELLRRTRGMDHRLSGEVRLSTTDSLAVDFVLPALARLHLEHPDIRVLLDSASAVVDLPKRETDIAIRTLRPENPDLILRKLASWPMGLFASADYLRRNGVPVPGERFCGHDLVMYEPYWHSQRELTLGGEPIRDGRVVIAVNSNMMVRQALARGLGLCELPLYMGERDGLVRVWPQRERRRPYEVWMVTHKDLRHTARVRAVIERLVEAFAEAPA